MRNEPRRGGGDDRRSGGRRGRRKRCQVCTSRQRIEVDYKNTDFLRQYLDDRSRIRKARQTGSCRRHQNQIAQAIKRAREIALLPYTSAQWSSSSGR